MAQSRLSQERDAMIDYMLTHTVGDNLEVIVEDDTPKKYALSFKGEDGQQYLIRLLSRQWEVAPDFKYDQSQFDESRRQLLASLDKVTNMIVQTNEQGKIPGFFLLRSDTDYSQFKHRTKPIINEGGHFMKQMVGDNGNPNPLFDERMLDPVEVALQLIHRQTNGLKGRKPTHERQKVHPDKSHRQLGIKIYKPELYYFNPLSKNPEEMITIAYFMNVDDPEKFKLASCPACHNPNGKDYNHGGCKGTQNYQAYRANRDDARYHKLAHYPKDRQPGPELHFDSNYITFHKSVPSPIKGLQLARLRGKKETIKPVSK